MRYRCRLRGRAERTLATARVEARGHLIAGAGIGTFTQQLSDLHSVAGMPEPLESANCAVVCCTVASAIGATAMGWKLGGNSSLTSRTSRRRVQVRFFETGAAFSRDSRMAHRDSPFALAAQPEKEIFHADDQDP